MNVAKVCVQYGSQVVESHFGLGSADPQSYEETDTTNRFLA